MLIDESTDLCIQFGHARYHALVQWMREQRAVRLWDCGLEMHPGKARIMYCKDSRKTQNYEHVHFDFLGYTFRPRRVVDRKGRIRTGFTRTVSRQSMTAMRQSLRHCGLHLRSELSHEQLAAWLAPRVRGWMAYYCRFRGGGVPASGGRHRNGTCQPVSYN